MIVVLRVKEHIPVRLCDCGSNLRAHTGETL